MLMLSMKRSSRAPWSKPMAGMNRSARRAAGEKTMAGGMPRQDFGHS
jgi:hypothetical protein